MPIYILKRIWKSNNDNESYKIENCKNTIIHNDLEIFIDFDSLLKPDDTGGFCIYYDIILKKWQHEKKVRNNEKQC